MNIIDRLRRILTLDDRPWRQFASVDGLAVYHPEPDQAKMVATFGDRTCEACGRGADAHEMVEVMGQYAAVCREP